MTVSVEQVKNASDIKTFVELPYRAYRGEPHWRAPLRIERREHFDPAKNRSLNQLKPSYFLASRQGQVVGRIASFVNPIHLQNHDDQTGHFGFLDTLHARDDETVVALLQAAESDLRAKGMSRIGGPYNFSVNDECGLLVDGFDTPPSVMMPYGRSDLPEMLEEAGYLKAMDMYAFRHRMGDTFSTPPFVSRVKKRFETDPAVSVRPLNISQLYEDIALIVGIFNDAWSENWGFLPISDAEARFLADSMKPVLQSESLWIAFVDDEPASFTLMIPNLNEATLGLDGRLLPFGWAALLYRIKVAGVKSARIPLAGTRKKFHKTRRGMTATVGAWEACLSAQHAKGVREVEFSWVLETNKDLLGLADIYDCDRYKTYRIYEKAL
ncbi:MAG: hypothetical protein QNI84_02270 [Henriciella sp.]|nr:hypothetical protein [Henriciella sp.]